MTDDSKNAGPSGDTAKPPGPWLPNLVGGISIWKLARDLNEAQFFDGRLLVPETEGTDALPTTVRWDVTGLLPLPEARKKYPAEVEASIRDFLARLEKVAAEFSNEASGYHKFKEAFTVPGLDAGGGAYYFYDERTKKLCLINWGASPRTIAGQQELIFGWGSFGKLVETAGPLGAAAAAGALAAAAAVAKAPAAAPPAGALATAPKKPEEKKDEKKEEKKPVPVGRPWWHWVLVLLAVLLLLALLLFLFKDCALPGGVSYPEGGASDGFGGDGMSEAAAAATDGATAADAATEAAADAKADGGDASGDGASDAPADGAKDGAADARADAKDDGGGNGKGPGGGPGGVGIGPGGPGGVVVGPGGVIPSSSLPHRFHFEPNAVKWRIASGQSQLDPSSPLEGTGQNFEVILTPAGSFDKVKVQWQDPSGRWHE